MTSAGEAVQAWAAGASDEVRAALQRLLEAGAELPRELQDEVIALGPAAVGPLLAIVADESLHEEGSLGDGFGPLHAIEMLGDLKAEAAIASLLALLATAEVGEYLFDACVLSLERMGPAALEPALAALAVEEDDDQRGALLDIVASLGVKDPRIYDALLDGLERSDVEESGFPAGLLASYGDPAALPALLAAFDDFPERDDPERPYGNLELREVALAIRELGGALGAGREARLARLEATIAGWQRTRGARSGDKLDDEAREELAGAAEPEAAPAVKERKLGRNEPCHCGSGKKYKKCCLARDEGAAPEDDGPLFVTAPPLDE